MRVLCAVDDTELHVPAHAFQRSLLLADISSWDYNGFVPLPCDKRTWEAWLTGDPTGIHDTDLLLKVFEVSSMAYMLK
jgi:hypothetical protein